MNFFLALSFLFLSFAPEAGAQLAVGDPGRDSGSIEIIPPTTATEFSYNCTQNNKGRFNLWMVFLDNEKQMFSVRVRKTVGDKLIEEYTESKNLWQIFSRGFLRRTFFGRGAYAGADQNYSIIASSRGCESLELGALCRAIYATVHRDERGNTSANKLSQHEFRVSKQKFVGAKFPNGTYLVTEEKFIAAEPTTYTAVYDTSLKYFVHFVLEKASGYKEECYLAGHKP